MIDTAHPYYKQLELLLDLLRVAPLDERFALKGGAAINLFMRDLPRLSVDIDLTYLPLAAREKSLLGIQEGLGQMEKAIKAKLKGATIVTAGRVEGHYTKLLVRRGLAGVKIEVSSTLRGSVRGAQIQTVMESVENVFGFAEFPILDSKDVYAGKLCAALDRQHPRDFFDLKVFFENGGLDEDQVMVFLVYLLSGDKPISEMLDPKPIPLKTTFESQFLGMSLIPVTLAELEHTRSELITTVRGSLKDAQKVFLMTFKSGDPDWDLLGLPNVDKLPAIQWKLQNVRKMTRQKRQDSLDKLRKVLGA